MEFTFPNDFPVMKQIFHQQGSLPEKQFTDEMLEKGGLQQHRKDKPEECPQKMGIVGNMVRFLFAHVPGISKIPTGEKDPGNGQKSEKIEFFPGIQKNEREQNSRNSPGSPHGIVVVIVTVFKDRIQIGYQNPPKIEQQEKNNRRVAEIIGKKPFNRSSEEKKHQHIHQQMGPSCMNKRMTEQPVVLFLMNNFRRIELQLIHKFLVVEGQVGDD